MPFDDNGGRAAKNYEPNSHDGPAQTGEAPGTGFDVSGRAGAHAPLRHAEDDDFVQAGALFRVMDEAAQERLVRRRS